MTAQDPLSLKTWLPLLDAARHLSKEFRQDVTEADVLRLGLDGHLRLSFNFVNPTPAVLGSITSVETGFAVAFPIWYGGTKTVRLPPSIADGLPSTTEDKVFQGDFGIEIQFLKGVWDLLLIQDGPQAVEAVYQEMTGGPEVRAGIGDGVLVASEDGKIARLKIELGEVRKRAMAENAHHAMTSPTNIHNYALSHVLPMEDGHVVVRVSVLKEFAARLRGQGELIKIAQIPGMIAALIHPWHVSQTETITGQRLDAEDAWDKEVSQAIYVGELPLIDPTTMLPYPPQSQWSAHAFTRRDRLHAFLARRGISLKDESLLSAAKSSESPAKRVKETVRQENEILRVLHDLNYDPLALPPRQEGYATPKKNVRERVDLSDRAFDKAWQRLRNRGAIREVPDPVQKP